MPGTSGSRTATFLMTDIAGSTRLWEEHPDAMAAALRTHDALLRTAVESAGGVVIKTTGDGVLAAFDAPGAALRAALDGQRRLRDQAWAETGPLQVRMAINTGAAEARDGDYHGTALNRVARLLAIGHGGQLLLSASTTTLVEDDLPADAELIDRGEHRLKDLSRPEHVFQLVAADLARDFPALRSESPQSNLPAQLTSFIGRARELREVAGQLEGHRLVTLVGVGGTGKTRLMLRAADALVGRYRDGVWLVELAAVMDPELIPQEVARALGIPELPRQPVLQTVTDYLRARELLLLLDNCEHLVDATAALVARLLPTCRDLHVLATSREALGVPGETIVQVPSLGVPAVGPPDRSGSPGAADDPAAIETSEAVLLFLDRARTTMPAFTADATALTFIADICRRLDGIPLAIELAAARVNVLSVEQIAQRLGDRFRLLTGGRRTAVPRQQTLQTLIDWSWDLLTLADQRLLRRLSVFVGGWTLADAVAITADDAAATDAFDLTVDGLGRLVDRSMLVVDREGETRFRMLETIRQYARDRLVASGETEALRDRHLARFAGIAVVAADEMEGAALPTWLRWFDTEIENLRSAMDWAFGTSPEAGIRLAVAVGQLWRHRPAWVEAPDRMRQAVETLRALPEPSAEERPARLALEARVLTAAGQAAAITGRTTGVVRDWTVEGVRLARESGDRKVLCAALLSAALAMTFGGASMEQIGPVFDEALPLAEELGEWSKYAYIAAGYAIYMAVADAASAPAWIERATAAARRSGDPSAITFAAVGRGRMLGARGDMAGARAAFAEAWSAATAVGSRPMALMARSDLGHALRASGELDEAEATYRETILEWQALGQRGAIASQLEAFGYIAIMRADTTRAATLLGAAEAIRQTASATMLPHERLEHEQQLARLQARPDRDVVGRAWATGRERSIEEAVAIAREG